MFKLAAVCCLVLGSAAASAVEYKFINTDGSALGQLCIAAVESSDKDVSTLASELGISPVEVQSVACNGESLRSFARKFSAEKAATIKTYVVNVGNQTPETQLCFAALVSTEQFNKLKDTQFKNVRVEQEIQCNGMPIMQFVNKYRDRLAATAAGKPETAAL